MRVLRETERLYREVYERLERLAREYEQATASIAVVATQDRELLERRKANLEEQLASIDDYREKVKAYAHAAEKTLKSRNHSTIVPRELNFNKLRNWAMMVGSADPDEHGDDPYARRIHYLCMCNLLYLDQKQADFERRLKVLAGEAVELEDEGRRRALLAQKAHELELAYADLVASEPFDALAKALGSTGEGSTPLALLGHEERPLPVVLDDARALFKRALGAAYDDEKGVVLLPVAVDLGAEATIVVGHSSSKEKRVFSAVQRLLAGVVEAGLRERREIMVLDPVHFNDSLLNSHLELGDGIDLRGLRDTGLMAAQPRTSEQVDDALRLVVSSFEEAEEAIGMAETVAEHNAQVPFERQIARRVLVLVGYPTFFSEDARRCVVRILSNQERYGVTVVLLDGHFQSRQGEGPEPPVDLPQNLYRVHCGSREALRVDDLPPATFHLARFAGPLSPALHDAVAQRYRQRGELGNEYVRRVEGFSSWPSYERGNKSIVLPWGVRADGSVSTIAFDDENFAAYLMGASGSGKSTLLHALITGIIGRYHPDDVELWLADFKMAEFSQYVDPMPPHVRYILLDESPELVFDLLNRLTEEMMERQRFFMQHRSIKKVEDVPRELRHMPIIFVILDEFSIMSQAIADVPAYKLKLQNLLAKGRALGIKFLFSSQQFTTGTTGLTPTAKAQVQSRIAMKNGRDEISQTLDLSPADKTDKVRAWMNALPPHYALYKYREGETVHVERQLVLYFAGAPEEAFAPQRELIARTKERLHAVESYDPSDDASYVDKHPVVVDGNSFEAFDPERVTAAFDAFRRREGDLGESDTLLSFGSPRRLCETKVATLSAASRENILLVAPTAEQSCALSVVLSAMRSAALQGRKVRVWGYERNGLYRAFRARGGSDYEVCEGLDAICNDIRDLGARVRDKRESDELIVLMGMESVCPDFELMEPAKTSPRPAALTVAPTAEAVYVRGEDPAADARQALADEWRRVSGPLRRALRSQGLTAAQIKERLAEERRAFFSSHGLTAAPDAAAPVVSPLQEVPCDFPVVAAEVPAPVSGGAYNAREDLLMLLRQGSRLGYHFMLCLSSLSDLVYVPGKIDLYRMRLSFRVSVDDSRELFRTRVASTLPEHICQFSDALESYSLRPYLHRGTGWDGWYYDEESGRAVNSFDI